MKIRRPSRTLRYYSYLITIFCFVSVCLYFYNSSKDSITSKTKGTRDELTFLDYNGTFVESKTALKYILMWTHNYTYPFFYLRRAREVFLELECEYTNCYFTNDRKYLPNLGDFDAIVFHGPEFTYTYNPWHHGFPDKRSMHQKYVYTCIESADYYPACNDRFNNYFNWTWTYKVDSDVKWGYVGIRDKRTGKIVGPSVNMSWETDMIDISEEKKKQLSGKTKAAAWFVSNCFTKSRREVFAKRLQKSLKRYQLSIDIYGKCGSLICERDTKECYDKITNDYYFYLSFENSISEDYVTEKFVNAMKYGAVPIVWGGADYSRFAPPGSYINAHEINDADKVAELMYNSINDPDEYASYFKWTNYYSYQRDIETADTRAACNLCKALNDPVKMSVRQTYSNFIHWWSGNNKC